MLPEELRSLLGESDGIGDRYGTTVIWPAGTIAGRNLEFRSNPDFGGLYMPFQPLLFFGDAGNGDQFFYRILGGGVADPDVYRWDHETDSRQWHAPTLGALLESFLNPKTG